MDAVPDPPFMVRHVADQCFLLVRDAVAAACCRLVSGLVLSIRLRTDTKVPFQVGLRVRREACTSAWRVVSCSRVRVHFAPGPRKSADLSQLVSMSAEDRKASFEAIGGRLSRSPPAKRAGKQSVCRSGCGAVWLDLWQWARSMLVHLLFEQRCSRPR